ncbi:MAG: CHAT domain-containing protein [Myxococcales bacterium]|nr:CHAT domain-containing protein [Myxococcales bacterium]
MTALTEFEHFLLLAFSAGELRRFIGYLPGGDQLVNSLPGEIVAPAELAHATALLLERTGVLRSAELWDALIEARTGRAPEICALRGKFVTGAASPPATRQAPPASAARRILFVSASPASAPPLAVDREFRRLREALRAVADRDAFSLNFEPAADYDALEAALRTSKPHILHLSCHGDDAGNLHLADDRNDTEDISADMFLGLLKALPGDLELVVLNACNSDVIAERIPPLVRHAIGMRDRLEDTAAIDFTRKLYENLAERLSLGAAFDLAINKLRKYGAHESPRLFGP